MNLLLDTHTHGEHRYATGRLRDYSSVVTGNGRLTMIISTGARMIGKSSFAWFALAVRPGVSLGDTFYVSSQGSDHNSGSLAKPFATLERAHDAVRALKKGPLTQPVQVLIGGFFYLTAPFVLAAEDSGTAACPIT